MAVRRERVSHAVCRWGRARKQETYVCQCARTVGNGEGHGFGASVVVAILH
jgi:hypothetical protein